jgi:hypothetical protein
MRLHTAKRLKKLLSTPNLKRRQDQGYRKRARKWEDFGVSYGVYELDVRARSTIKRIWPTIAPHLRLKRPPLWQPLSMIASRRRMHRCARNKTKHFETF